MDSLIDLIIIILVMIIAYYFLSLSKTCPDTKESMCNFNREFISGPNDSIEYPQFRDAGTTGLDRTNKKLRWYHVTNRLINQDSCISDKQANLEKLKRIVYPDNYNSLDEYTEPKPELCDRKYVCHLDYQNNETNKDFLDLQSQMVKKFIRDKVLNGDVQCGCAENKSSAEFSRDEVDNYREKQLHFRDKIMGTSDPVFDPVDKMNEITVRGGILPSNRYHGHRVADVYDSIICNKDGK